jgi:hypothetical protein
MCSNDCPPDWVCKAFVLEHNRLVNLCVPFSDVYCVQCVASSECAVAGDKCLDLSGATYCTRDCSAAGACPPAYECRDVPFGQTAEAHLPTFDGGLGDGGPGEAPGDGGGPVFRQCLPISGKCPGCIDRDGDRYGVGADCLGPDCDDTNAAIHPGAVELCDGVDNNCDGVVDEGFDLSSDNANCGACGRHCEVGLGLRCCGGVCVEITTSLEHCGGCGHLCTGDGAACCEGMCQSTLSDPGHCGGCGRACQNEHGDVGCEGGECKPLCAPGYGDCDGVTRNGCDTALTTVENCGVCGRVCRNPHGTTSCVGGACTPACAADYGNCEGDDQNGCETDLLVTTAHCGRCGQRCVNEHGPTSCVQGVCRPVCELNWGDCDQNRINGCETDLATSVATCGGCRTACTNEHGTTSCQGGVCLPTCDPGFKDCDRNPRNGCESNLQTSLLHCGECDHPCTNSHGTTTCAGGVCVPSCTSPYADCDGNPANGCETNTNATIAHCGGCNLPCANSHGSTLCSAGACVPSCGDGWGDCNGNPRDGCETDLTRTVAHCGGCNQPCLNPNGTTRCEAGACQPTCAPGYFDCNGNPRDGCEANLSQVTTCNSCQTDANCPPGFYCNQGLCTKKKARGEDCTEGRECVSTYCTDGVCCDGGCPGLCRSCRLAATKGTCTFVPSGEDPDGECGPQDRSTCGRDGFCDGSGGCRLWAPGTPCHLQSCADGAQSNPSFCDGFGNCPEAIPATTLCAPYVCNGTTACFAGCGTDAQCAMGYICVAGVCKVAPGNLCNGPADCSSTFCVDGVCCNEKCDGLCEKCNLPGHLGVCTALPAGSDPDDECATEDVTTCGRTGACSGNRGACQLYGSGTICLAQSCVAGVQTHTRTCNGSGTCLTPTPATTACFPYVCNATTQACFTSCATGAECVQGYGCAAGGVCKKVNGQSCTLDGECQSGFCTDKVCCAARCGGVCEKCNILGREGFCDAVPAGSDPDTECGAEGVSTCGRTGECSGARSCALFSAGTVCAQAFCSGNTSNFAHTCNGSGTCLEGGTQACAPFTCNPTNGLCRTSCGAPGDCIAGYECVGGGCKKSLGQLCGSDPECASGFCADGVCCNGRCGGVCEKCNQGGRVGYCDPVPSGQDPDNECAQDAVSSCQRNGSCSGARSCALYATGTICTAAFCSGNVSNLADTCNGLGTCVDNGILNCLPYVCNPTNGLCKTSCGTTVDCQSGYECQGTVCKKSQGGTCNDDAQCASGFCMDGVCCGSRCGGICERCDLPGRAGFCDPVPAGNDPDNECATDPVSSCGKTGACSGSRACALYASGTVCVAASCASASTANRADTCNGLGTCVDNGIQSCAPYICSGTACKTSCDLSSDCVAGYSCKTSTHQCLKNDGQPCTAGSECLNNACCAGYCRNLATDTTNCGACGIICQTNTGTATNPCVSGTCSPTCNATYYNLDGNNPNGCECRQDTYDVTGNNNLTPGSEEISDCGDTRDVWANLVPSSDNDFYYAWVTDTFWCTFNLIVDLTNIPAGTDYDLYVYKLEGSSWILVDASVNGGNANEEVVYGGGFFSDDSGWYGFEVRRYSGPTMCASYHLHIVNGS